MEFSGETKLFLYLDLHNRQLPHPETLEGFLNSTPRRDDRLRLGHTTILTLLKLGPDWTPETWSKNSPLLLPTQDPTWNSAAFHPYLSHDSIHTTLQVGSITSKATEGKARASLLALGILLLELLFRETIEQQPFHDELLSQGHPNDLTELCTALQWQRKVEEEFGDKLADAIRRCLLCAFDTIPNLENSEFVRAIWVKVVKPIEEFLTAYK